MQVDENFPTIESYLRPLKKENILLRCCPLTAINHFRLQMRDNYFRTGEGFLCVYAVTMLDSYEQMAGFVEQILKVTEDEDVCRICYRSRFECLTFLALFFLSQIPVLIVGNKVDLADKRQVTTAQGEKLAASLRCPFLETSTYTLSHTQSHSHTHTARSVSSLSPFVLPRSLSLISSTERSFPHSVLFAFTFRTASSSLSSLSLLPSSLFCSLALPPFVCFTNSHCCLGAKTNTNVEKAFTDLVRRVIARKKSLVHTLMSSLLLSSSLLFALFLSSPTPFLSSRFFSSLSLCYSNLRLFCCSSPLLLSSFPVFNLSPCFANVFSLGRGRGQERTWERQIGRLYFTLNVTQRFFFLFWLILLLLFELVSREKRREEKRKSRREKKTILSFFCRFFATVHHTFLFISIFSSQIRSGFLLHTKCEKKKELILCCTNLHEKEWINKNFLLQI